MLLRVLLERVVDLVNICLLALCYPYIGAMLLLYFVQHIKSSIGLKVEAFTSLH